MVLLLLACTEPEGPSFVAPFDGATGLPVDTVPRVHAASLRLPEGQPVAAEVLQVVDLETGGFVDGDHVVEAGELLFRPEVPLLADHDYGWAVLDAPDDARQPVVVLDPGLLGDALFSTRSGPLPLDASLEGGLLCLLFSEEPTATRFDLEVNGKERPGRTWDPMFLTSPGGGDALTAACIDGDLGVAQGDVVRVFDESGGSSTVLVGAVSLAEAWLGRHRWVEP